MVEPGGAARKKFGTGLAWVAWKGRFLANSNSETVVSVRGILLEFGTYVSVRDALPKAFPFLLK